MYIDSRYITLMLHTHGELFLLYKILMNALQTLMDVSKLVSTLWALSSVTV